MRAKFTWQTNEYEFKVELVAREDCGLKGPPLFTFHQDLRLKLMAVAERIAYYKVLGRRIAPEGITSMLGEDLR